jgi:uncharacterized protein (TIGR00255 family)
MKSMTAYSRASVKGPAGQFVVEIHSVNRRMLDIGVYLPKDMLRFDLDVRKWVSQVLERGQVTVRVTLISEEIESKLSSHFTQLKTLKSGWDKLASDLGYDPRQAVDFPFLISQMQSIALPEHDEEGLKKSLKEAVDIALQELLSMKETEGKNLAQDIQKRLKLIEENLAAIGLKKEEPYAHYRKKIFERLKEIGHLHGEAEERVAREVAILAERMDVTEELVRLRSHIDQFRQHLFSVEKAVGRTLDFLTQEMQREINTLGAKSADSETSLYVVRIKSELDKIREQVQNIE